MSSVSWRAVQSFFFFLFTGENLLASALERRWAPRTSPQYTKSTSFLQGWAGGQEKAGLPSASHPPALSQRTPCVHALCTHAPCTHALCARTHKTTVSSGYRVLVYARLCPLSHGVPCSPFSTSCSQGKISSPQHQRGGGLPAPPPSTPEPASSPHKVKTRPGNPHNLTALTSGRFSNRSLLSGLPAITQAWRSSGTPRAAHAAHTTSSRRLNAGSSRAALLRMRVKSRSTQHKPGIRRTPRRHRATRSDGLPQGSTPRQTRNRTPGELPAGIPTPRNDGPPPKLDADTSQCTARRQRTPRQHFRNAG